MTSAIDLDCPHCWAPIATTAEAVRAGELLACWACGETTDPDAGRVARQLEARIEAKRKTPRHP